MESVELKRVHVRTDSAAPNIAKSTTAIDEPILAKPYKEKVAPNRAKFRNANVLPNSILPNIDIAAPSRAKLLSETDAPTITKSTRDKEDPSLATPKTANEDPML
eukprot:TRINITY_DN21379_c0_g1_i1.p2 TRINITY_DN21379_c0_g1~~TRINITY_DN21379_c0_g1_i1.p2  ORF type:complete len:105 (+),score=6.74 TRINITY_DN21379_c0_g1_i1:258-572(+)